MKAERQFEWVWHPSPPPTRRAAPPPTREPRWFAPAGARRRPTDRLLGLLWLPLLPLLLAITVGAWMALIGMSFISPAGHVAASFQSANLPKTPIPAQSTYLFDSSGKPLTMLNSGVNRTVVPSSQIPETMKQATVAIEDRNFYHEGGVSPEGTIRAAITDLVQHRAVQGGSTITQQYVKLVYTGDERTLSRKLKEAVLAQKLSHVKTKDDILTDYLNTVYFGNEAYGVQAAAETYWHEPARKLSLLQSATLAAMIQAPVAFDPYTHKDDLKARRNLVLQEMAQQRYITPDQAAQLSLKPVKVKKPGTGPVPAAYFVDSVSRTLQQKYGIDTTFHGGLRVTTTLNRSDQQAAEAAIASHLKAHGDPSAALVAMDPTTGAIRAMVGGRDFTRVKFNLATQARRQTGSAAKPFTFITAMSERIDPRAVLAGPPELVINKPECSNGINKPWDVHNYADERAGTMNLFDALANSVNTIFAQLVVDVGPGNVVKTMHKLGITTPLQAVCSITLGSQAVTPLEMTQAYASIADGGVRHTPQVLQKVADPVGGVIGRLDTTGTRVFGANDAWLTVKAMEGVIQHGTGTAAQIGRPEAGKTGTGQDFQDAWFCGFVPQLVTCVWVGYPKGEIPMHNVEGFPDVFGGSIPAEIWHDFMEKAVRNLAVRNFPTPSLSGYDVKPNAIAPIAPHPRFRFRFRFRIPSHAPRQAPRPPNPRPSPGGHQHHCHHKPHCNSGAAPAAPPSPAPRGAAVADMPLAGTLTRTRT